MAVIAEIEKHYKGVFKYVIYRDKSITGRLEVTLYRPGKEEGIVLHSKQQSKRFIHEDYPTFFALLEVAMKQ